MLIKFYELSLQRIRDQKDQYLHRLSSGAIQNFEDYRDLSGKIFGLRQAEEIIKEVFDDIQMPNKKFPTIE
jgi:hypothetical protein